MRMGLIGPEELVAENIEIFGALGHEGVAIVEPGGLDSIDGLVITAWRAAQLRRLKRLRRAIKEQKRLTVMGVALGAYALGQNGYLALMNYQTYFREEEGERFAMVSVPSWDNHRMTAVFHPQVCFGRIAPNLGIVCGHSELGPLILRQGNYLAAAFAPEAMSDRAIYRYFLEMTARAQS